MQPKEKDSALSNEEERLRTGNESVIEAWRDYLDIAVPLTFEIGRTKVTARTILGLEINSIVQLKDSTGEGVDIFAGAKRLARGEVIMIENHTGIRVNEVIVKEHE
jgi:flagellar motor switch/type III secretory pathway protein FliN